MGPNSGTKRKAILPKGSLYMTKQSISRPTSARERFELNAQKRNKEAWKHEDMVNSVTEMKKREWAAKVYTSLASKKRDPSCLDWREREEINRKLEARREKLRKLFAEEELKFEKEREEKRKSKNRMTEKIFHPEIELLRGRLDELKRQNEEERKKLSDKLSYESWRKNNPELRQMESDRLNKYIMEAWVDQKQWKEDQRRVLEEERHKAETELLEQQQKEEEERRKKEQRRREDCLKWTKFLEEQVQELKEREEEEEIIRQKEIILEKESSRLQELIDKRSRMKEERKRKNLELYWARQYQLKLKKKTADIQTELLSDSLFLEDLLSRVHVGGSLEEKEEFLRERDWMRNLLEKQKNLEKLREKEYDLLFSEEAERMWKKREAEWEREQRARDKLMEDVMKELEAQVQEKLTSLKHGKDACKKEKEDLMLSIEDAQKKIEDKFDEGEDDAFKKQNPKPFSSDRNIRRQELLMDQQVEDRQKEIARLEEEMRKLWQASYVPPKYGRKRTLY